MVQTEELITLTNVPKLDNASILSFKISANTIKRQGSLAKLCRFINKFAYRYGVGASLVRYDSSISFYSARRDKKLYEDYPENSIFLNFGSGAFSHPRWRNLDYPATSNFYKPFQRVINKDFHHRPM